MSPWPTRTSVGERDQAAENGERIRLRLDRLLCLVLDDRQDADIEINREVILLRQLALERRELPLNGQQAGHTARKPHRHPAETPLPVQVRGGGSGRQNCPVDVIELIAERGRSRGDRGDHKSGSLRCSRRRAGWQPVRANLAAIELPGHVRAGMQAESLGHRLGDRYLVRRIERWQLPGQHRHLVLPEVLATQARGNRVRLEGRIDLPINDGLGVQPEPRRGRQPAVQPLHLADDGQQRARYVDHHVACLCRLQIAAVSRIGPPCSGQRGHRCGPEQATDQRDGQCQLPGLAPAHAPRIKGGTHDGIVSRGNSIRQCGCTTSAGESASRGCYTVRAAAPVPLS